MPSTNLFSVLVDLFLFLLSFDPFSLSLLRFRSFTTSAAALFVFVTTPDFLRFSVGSFNLFPADLVLHLSSSAVEIFLSDLLVGSFLGIAATLPAFNPVTAL